MGTAARFKGPDPGSALIPTWLEEPASEAPGNNPPDAGDNTAASGNAPQSPSLPKPLPPAGQPNRFTSARRHFNSAAGSNDKRALDRAVSSYVRKSAGGARSAMRKMGAARGATRRVVAFLGDVSRVGAATALRNLGFGQLIGQPAEVALADC